MNYPIKSLKLISATSAMLALASANSALAQDVYSDCSCVTGVGTYSDGVGQIIASSGEVLVNNVGTSQGQILPASSEIMVGAGSVTYSIGANCSNRVGANTMVSISQPAGPGSNLCVRVASIDLGFVTQGANVVNPINGLITVVVGSVGAAVTPFGSDGKGRPPASN